jgi:uncharacterized BrkB/YihY/UPF0761 family membrane protein
MQEEIRMNLNHINFFLLFILMVMLLFTFFLVRTDKLNILHSDISIKRTVRSLLIALASFVLFLSFFFIFTYLEQIKKPLLTDLLSLVIASGITLTGIIFSLIMTYRKS